MPPQVIPSRNRSPVVALVVAAALLLPSADAPRAAGSSVGAASLPQQRSASASEHRAVPGQPSTVAGDVAIDIAAAMPSSAFDRSGPEEVRINARVRTGLIRTCPGFWFTALGVVWNQRGSGRVGGSVAWLDNDGRVLGRQRLEVDVDGRDAGPAAPGQRSTDLVWTGGGRCAEIRFDLQQGVTISRPHLAFVNTSGSSHGPGTGPPNVTTEPDVVPASDASVGGPAMPRMVSRAAWGADPKAFDTSSTGCAAPYYSPIKVAYVHHTGGSNSYSPSQSDDLARGIYWYHTQERGYCDIAYNFLVDRWGTILVGRAGGVDLPVTPGSQAGFNPFTFSVSVMGNFAATNPPVAAIGGVERVLAWKLDVAHVPADGSATLVSQGFDTDRYPVGQRITMHTIEGHRRTSQTDCPGRIWNLLPQIRRTVAAMGGAKIYRPSQSALQVRLGKPVTLSATANRGLLWTVTILGPGGGPVRHLTPIGRSASLSTAWDGLDRDGNQLPTGKYLAMIGGTAKDGEAPRTATLQVDVPGPAPGPRPVPTGTAHVPSGFGTFRDAAATGPRDVWAVGVVAGRAAVRPLVRHRDSDGWRSSGVPNPGDHGSGFQSVDATAPDDAWAGGFTCLDADCGPNGGYGSRTLLEHWNGKAWSPVPTPSPGTALNEIRAVDAIAPDDAWAAGLWSDEGRWLRHGLVLHWDGQAWRQVPIPFVDGEVHLDGISATGPDDVWVVGEACPGPCSGLAHSTGITLHWDGTKFARVAPAPLGADRSGFDSVLAVSPTEAWAVGGRSANRVAPSRQLVERWDGSHWRSVDTPKTGKGAHWFAVATVPGAGLLSGGSWVPASSGRPLVMRRNASGAWARATVPSPNVHLAYLTGIAAISRDDVWVVGPATSGPLALHWNGSAWRVASTG